MVFMRMSSQDTFQGIPVSVVYVQYDTAGECCRSSLDDFSLGDKDIYFSTTLDACNEIITRISGSPMASKLRLHFISRSFCPATHSDNFRSHHDDIEAKDLPYSDIDDWETSPKETRAHTTRSLMETCLSAVAIKHGILLFESLAPSRLFFPADR